MNSINSKVATHIVVLSGTTMALSLNLIHRKLSRGKLHDEATDDEKYISCRTILSRTQRDRGYSEE